MIFALRDVSSVFLLTITGVRRLCTKWSARECKNKLKFEV